jgi:hypothetical protein
MTFALLLIIAEEPCGWAADLSAGDIAFVATA